MGDYLRKQYDDMYLESQDKEPLYEKIISFICSFFVCSCIGIMYS